MAKKKTQQSLTRPKKDRMLGGVASGLANYFSLDVSLMRVAMALLILSVGIFPGLLAYVIAWMVIPEGK